MAQGIVDYLETVQVQEQYRHGPVVPTRPGNGLIEPIEEQHAIRQARQYVMMGEILKVLLYLHAFGDVLARGDELDDFPVLIPERGNCRLFVIELAVFLAVDEHIPEHPSADNGPPKPLIELPAQPPGLDQPRCLADDLIGTVSRDFPECLVDIFDYAQAIGNDHRIGRLLERA